MDESGVACAAYGEVAIWDAAALSGRNGSDRISKYSLLKCLGAVIMNGAARPERLSDIAIQRGLGSLPGWSRKGDVLSKTFQFETFPDGIAFVTHVAEAAEAAQHHPDVDIRYTKITCMLTTHDAGGITQKDLNMANEIEFAATR